MMLAVLSLCMASCYDDSELRESIASLQERVLILEKQMADNVAAVQSIISVGSIASWTYNAETGKGVITMVDGTTIEVNQNVKGNSVITVERGEDGAYYWAICRDGVNIPLMVDNKKVSVTVTPALKISSENEWMISADGGKTWINTGISYSPPSDQEGGSDDTQSEVVLFEKIEKVGESLQITLVGGEVIKVAIVGEASFKALDEKIWFSRVAMEKSVPVEMTHVKAFTVTEKPDGWRVRIEDDAYLYVTSPDNFEDYPDHGTVKILAVFDNGALPEIMCIDVAYEPVVQLSSLDAAVTATVSEHTADDFNGYLIAFWRQEDYSVDAAVQWLNSQWSTMTPQNGTVTYDLSDVIDNFSEEEQYVAFAVPYLPPLQVEQGKMKYVASDIQIVECIEKKSFFEISEIRFDSAHLETLMNAAQYYGGFMSAEVWTNTGKNNIIENLNLGGMQVCDKVEYDGPVNGFPMGTVEMEIIPATEYVVWYAAVKPDGEYTADDIVVHRFTSTDVAYDSTLPSPSYVVRDIKASGFAADVTPAAGAYKTYAAIMKSSVIPDTDPDIVRQLIMLNTVSAAADLNTISKYSFSPEDAVCLLAVSVSADGKYGEIVRHPVQLKELEYTDAMSMSITEIEYGLGDAVLNVSFTGNPVELTYMAAYYSYFEDPAVLEKMLALRQLGDACTVSVSDLGGKLKLDGLMIGAEYTLYAVLTDSEGRCSYLYHDYKFTPRIEAEYVLKDNPEYEYAMPVLSGVKNGTNYTLKVDMPSECVQYWLFCGDRDYFSNDEYLDTDKLVSMELKLSGETVHNTSLNGIVYEYVRSDSRIYMAWLDDKGRCHTIYEFNPNKK